VIRRLYRETGTQPIESDTQMLLLFSGGSGAITCIALPSAKNISLHLSSLRSPRPSQSMERPPGQIGAPPIVLG
jgi:hypothetical protein